MLRKAKGFTLIELMIVVAIIGILAAIAIPNFIKFQCRSKQSEAKVNLKALYVAEEAYYSEFDQYAAMDRINGGTNFDASTVRNPMGFVPKGEKLRYDYVVEDNDFRVDFIGAAQANDVDAALNGDTWRINAAPNGVDSTATPVNLFNACESGGILPQ